MLGGLLVYATLHTNWHSAAATSNLYNPIKKMDYSFLTKGNYVFPVLAVNVVLALVLADKLLHLRKHRTSTH
jgi:hypothetical protein